MEISKEKKIKRARIFGSSYFIALGTINFIATLIYSELRWLDLIILSLCVLPFLINKKIFSLLFGLLGAFISLYMALAGLIFMIDPAVKTPAFSFFMGFLLAGSMLIASLLLTYAGYASSEKIQVA